jgi:hypothetical protein
MLLWSAAFTLLQQATGIDSTEQFVWAFSRENGYWKHPPLPSRIMHGLMSALGPSVGLLFVAAQACLALALLLGWCLGCAFMSPRRSLIAGLDVAGRLPQRGRLLQPQPRLTAFPTDGRSRDAPQVRRTVADRRPARGAGVRPQKAQRPDTSVAPLGSPERSYDPAMSLRVECCAGYRGEREPVTLWFGERRCALIGIVDRWYAPTQRWFKVEADDGHLYIVRHDEGTGAWDLAALTRRVP